MLILIACIIASAAFIFLSFDIIAQFWQWQARIKIGKWGDLRMWEKAVELTCTKWLQHTPTVPQKDEQRLILWDIIRGQYKLSTIQYWQKAGLILGLCSTGEHQGEITKAINSFIDPNSGQWRNNIESIDIALLAYAILSEDSVESLSIKPAMEATYGYLLATKGDSETIPYRNSVPHLRFVDTLGFVCPFLMLYGQRYNCPGAIQLAKKQLACYDQALHPQWELPAHAFDIERSAPLGIYDWGRGIGWYIIALLGMAIHADCTQTLENLHFRIKRLADTLLQCELDKGGFGHQIFNQYSHIEGSATVCIGLLLHYCTLISNEERYIKGLQRTTQSLMRITRRDGSLDLCQGDTKGIGVYSTRFGIMPFAQGLLLLLIHRHHVSNS